MPRPARGRATRSTSTRTPAIHVIDGYLIETYNHPNDLPILSNQPRRRPRHATRGATAAERRADLLAATSSLDRTPSPPNSSPHPPTTTTTPSTLPPTSSPKPPRCSICLRSSNPSLLLHCLHCAKTAHAFCLNPPKTIPTPPATWTCHSCLSSSPRAPDHNPSVNTFCDALRKYNHLVPSHYLHAMTDTVNLAAKSEAARHPRHVTDSAHAIHFAVPLHPDNPPPPPLDDNTVILKIDATDSDLDELTPPASSLPRKRRNLKRRPVSLESSDDDVCLRHDSASMIQPQEHKGEELDKRGNPHNGSPSPSDDIPVKMPRRGRKRMRMTTRASIATRATTARASLSSEGEGRGNAVTRPASQDARGTANAGKRGTVRGGRRRKGGRGGGRRKEIWLKLRLRPPQRAGGAASAQGKAPREQKEPLRGKDKGKDTDKAKEKSKGNNKYKDMTQAERDAEMHRRLAKARAKKAELRKAAMMEKGTAAKQNAAAVSSEPASPEKHTLTLGSVSQKSIAGKAAPEKGTKPSEISKITPAVAVVKNKAQSSRAAAATVAAKREPSPGSRVGNGAAGIAADKRLQRKKIAEQPVEPTAEKEGVCPAENADMVKAVPMEVANREADGQGQPRGLFAKAPTVDRIKAGDDGAPKGMAIMRIEDRNSDMASDGSVQPPFEMVDTEADAAKKFAIKDALPGPRFDATYGVQLAGDGVSRRHPSDSGQFGVKVQPVYAEQKGRVEVPTQRSNRSDQNSTSGEHGVDQAGKVLRGTEERTAEQRTVANLLTLSQPAHVDATPRSFPSRWGSMSLDAKNEALLTLAKKQKGSVKRRPLSASCSLDRDMFSRNAKQMCRTDNVPESERKRIQVTAMVAEGRVRSGSIASPHTPHASLQRGSTIGRLLHDPLAPGSLAGTNQTAIGLGNQQGHNPSASHVKALELENDLASGHPKNENFLNTTDQTMQRNYGSVSYASRVLDIHDVRAGGIQVAEHSSAQAGTSPDVGNASQRGLWASVVPHQQGETARDVNMVAAVNLSSHSGSHSERGSSAAGAPTLVHTFKRTRKRPTLAVVHRAPVQRLSGGGADVARSASWGSRVLEEAQAVCNDRSPAMARQDIRVVGPRVSTMVKTGHRPSTQDRSSASRPTQLGSNPVGIPRPRSSGDFSEMCTDARAQNQVYPQETFADPQWRMMHEYPEGTGDGVIIRPGSGRLNSSIKYQGTPSTHEHGAADGSGEMRTRSHVSPVEPSDPTDQKSLRVSAGFNESLYRGRFERPNIDDGMNFPDSSRRLRRSVAPTLPTATRRFQYEQGRRMARYTPPSSTAEQQTYSSLRQRSSAPRLEENLTQVHTPEWDAREEGHASGVQTAQVQQGFEPQATGGPVLSHQYISQEGLRPQLAPVPPVVYEPEGIVRTQNEMRTGRDDIPLLLDAHRSPALSLPSPDGVYRSEPMSATDYVRSVNYNQPISQSREAMASLQHKAYRGDSPRAGMSGTGNVGVALRSDMRRGADAFAGSPGPMLRPTSAAFSPRSLPGGELQLDEPGTARSMQQSRRPRTDPSLKNLLT